MSQRLSSRLQKLEDEIQQMLIMQNERENCRCPRSTSVPASARKKTQFHSNSHSPADFCRWETCDSTTPRRNRKAFVCLNKENLNPLMVDQGLLRHIEEYKKQYRADQNEECLCDNCDSNSYKLMCTENALKMEKERRQQAEAIIEKLRNEAEANKSHVKELNQSKNAAIEMTRQLKQKYENLHKNNREAASKLKSLNDKNQHLCTCLTNINFSKSTEALKMDVNRMQGKAKRMFDKIEVDTITSTMRIVKTNEKLAKLVREKDNQIKALTENQEKLEKSYVEKETSHMKNYGKYAKMEVCLERCNEKISNLEEEKEKLKNDFRNLQIRYQESQKENRKLRNDNKDFENLIKTYDTQMEKIRDELTAQITQKLKKKQEQIEEEFKRKNKEQEEELVALTTKFMQLQCDCKERQKSERELQRLMDEHKKLQLKYDDLLKQLKDFETKDTQKCKCIEDEMRQLTRAMHQKESMLLREKEEMKKLVEDLTNLVKEHKQKIHDLQSKNQQQEAVLQSQICAINSKNEQIRLAEKEAQAFKQKKQQLEGQIENLRNKVKELEKSRCEDEMCNKRNEVLSQELKEARKSIESEKDKNLLKEKVIEDQIATIAKLKKDISEKERELKRAHEIAERASQEVQTTCCEMKKNQLELNKQKKENQMLLNDLTNMKTRNCKLRQKIENLENALETFCKCACSEDVENQQILIANLEKQVMVQQQEWELHKKIMSKEKEQALKAAKFATEKLLDSVNEFQRQIESQKKIQRTLTGMLQEKEVQLQKVATKMGGEISLTPKKTTHIELNAQPALLKNKKQPNESYASQLQERLHVQRYSENALRVAISAKMISARNLCMELVRMLFLVPLPDVQQEYCNCA